MSQKLDRGKPYRGSETFSGVGQKYPKSFYYDIIKRILM